MAGTCDREDRIIQYLRGKFGHVSAERAISGGGLENLYQAIAAIDGLTVGHQSAAEITNHALADSCEIAREALYTFCGLLGSFAGGLALTFGAKGGVYIAGGISPRILKFLAGSEFRSRFEVQGQISELPRNRTLVCNRPSGGRLRGAAISARLSRVPPIRK